MRIQLRRGLLNLPDSTSAVGIMIDPSGDYAFVVAFDTFYTVIEARLLISLFASLRMPTLNLQGEDSSSTHAVVRV